MLDTHIATDLIGDATFDVYDIALIVSEDSDFVPAVDFVQEMRNKQVVHVGFGSHLNELRNKCRHRIDLGRDRLFRRAQRPRNGAETSSTQPRAASNAVSASPKGRGSGSQS